MSMDRSLKVSGGLSKHRNVLQRAARIAKLQDEGRWEEDAAPFGLPKVANRKVKVGGRTKKKDEAAATEGEAQESTATAAETEKKT